LRVALLVAAERELTVAEDGLYTVEVFFRVDAYGVEVGGFYVDVDVVFEEAKLFEALGLFEDAGRQRGEALEGCLAVGVEADVLPVLWRHPIAVIWDCRAGEEEGTAVGGGDNFDGVWVGDVLGGAEDLES
jgi:hypothetical protein